MRHPRRNWKRRDGYINNQIYQLKTEVKKLRSELIIAQSEDMEVKKNKNLLTKFNGKKIINDEGKSI